MVRRRMDRMVRMERMERMKRMDWMEGIDGLNGLDGVSAGGDRWMDGGDGVSVDGEDGRWQMAVKWMDRMVQMDRMVAWMDRTESLTGWDGPAPAQLTSWLKAVNLPNGFRQLKKCNVHRAALMNVCHTGTWQLVAPFILSAQASGSVQGGRSGGIRHGDRNTRSSIISVGA